MQLPGDSGDVLAHPVIAKLHWPVITGVEDNYDVATRGFKDLILLELWGEVNKLQICEFAEGSWNDVVEEAQDEASFLGGVDDLGLEDYLVFTFFPADCYEVLLLTGEGGFAWIYSE